MAKQYFPPASVLCAAMGITPDALSKGGRVSVPTSLLRYLICAAISDLEIDPQLYKEQNPDIAKGFADRPASVVEAHYKTVGYFEPRRLPIRFDGEYYARRYPDVAKGIRDKKLTNAAQHFNETGVYELRCPRADLEKDVGQWRQILPVAPPLGHKALARAPLP
jgi:hypothetical protein